MRVPLVLAAMIGAAAPVCAEDLDASIGRALFRRAWVPAPSSSLSNDGLGPLFNARSCVSCHRHLDRARVDVDARGRVTSENLVLRFSDDQGRADPVYGRQLQSSAVTGAPPEGVVEKRSDGYGARDLAYGAAAPGIRIGALMAPALRGLGQLADIPDEAIAALAQRHVAHPDGVSGRVNWVRDASGGRKAGRFGWKASTASLTEQVETAFLLDLGLSTEGRPAASGDCTEGQTSCRRAPHGAGATGVEIPREMVARVTAYLASIAPVSPGAPDPEGARIFAATGCAACHVPSLPGRNGPVRAYTDLLLHDLGPALGDGATEPGIAPGEWRTAPLWGLGRTLEIGAGLLHDGRASNLPEAVAAHGGTAAASASRFSRLPAPERDRLLAFLKSL